MADVDVEQLAAAPRDAVVVDVREPEEHAAGHVPGARLVPLGDIASHLGDLPRHQRLYLICATGNRSGTVARWLSARGFDAVSVAGGTEAWKRSGRRVVGGSMERDEPESEPASGPAGERESETENEEEE